MNRPRLLVAGVGNIFLGDDGFGVEVAQRLQHENGLPNETRVVDFGIRGIDLTYALLDGYEFVILVDASPRGGAPGTVYVIEPEPADPERVENEDLLLQAHSLDPAKVLCLTRSLGSPVQQVLVVGCEPQCPEENDELPVGLSPPVQRAVDEAVQVVERLAGELLGGERGSRTSNAADGDR